MRGKKGLPHEDPDDPPSAGKRKKMTHPHAKEVCNPAESGNHGGHGLPLFSTRKRANKVRGHGTWEKDRPPILGIVGRESGQIRLRVLHNTAWKDLKPLLMEATKPGMTVNTDDWRAYGRLPEFGRIHVTVCHSPENREWARDDDGDGIREVHNNTIEGIWTGLRNFLRPFRGINKDYLQQYVSMHEWAHNLKEVTLDFLRILCGVTQLAT